MSIFESYKHCFSQSKTIQFSLIPEFETADNLEKFNIITEDQKKAEKYKVVKEVFDKCHKMFISECLDKYSTDNGMSVEDLKNKYPMLTFKCAKHDIVKDRRYSKPSFSFHVTITMNYAVDNKYPKFNETSQ